MANGFALRLGFGACRSLGGLMVDCAGEPELMLTVKWVLVGVIMYIPLSSHHLRFSELAGGSPGATDS